MLSEYQELKQTSTFGKQYILALYKDTWLKQLLNKNRFLAIYIKQWLVKLMFRNSTLKGKFAYFLSFFLSFFLYFLHHSPNSFLFILLTGDPFYCIVRSILHIMWIGSWLKDVTPTTQDKLLGLMKTNPLVRRSLSFLHLELIPLHHEGEWLLTHPCKYYFK